MSKPREPTQFFILVLIIIVFCAVIALEAEASTPPDNNQVKRETAEETHKNEVIISQITYCGILALNGNMPKQAKRYTAKLEKFDDFYHELKIFHAGQVIGLLKGINYQMGFPNPTNEQVKKLAIELYFRQCDIPF